MRLLIILAAVIVLLAVIGWITFSSDSGRTSINLETDEIREDTGEVMHKGSELLREAEQEVDPDAEDRADATTLPY